MLRVIEYHRAINPLFILKDREVELESVFKQYQRLSMHFNSLLIASISMVGVPRASYVPYIQALGEYYVVISNQDSQSQNLLKNCKVSVFFIDNEKQRFKLSQKQNRQRCEVVQVNQNSELYSYISRLFYEKFSRFMDLLEDRDSYLLFKINPA